MGPFRYIDQVPLFSHDFIMADPAWLFENWSEKGDHKNASAKYSCMTIDQICDLRVGDLASRDCVLFLWATNPLLDQAFRVLRAWGFKFCTAGTWIKTTVNEKIAFGTGYVLRSANEPFLIGTMGNPVLANNVRSAFTGLVREHSRKPDEGYIHAESMMPGPTVRRLDLFTRQTRKGWTAVGDQYDYFPPLKNWMPLAA